MPELPDLLHVLATLRAKILGRRVTAARLNEPVVLRSVVAGDLSLLVGRTVDDVQRRSHFLVFRFGDLDLAVNPMLAGRFKLAAPEDKVPASQAFALTLGDDLELRYLDDKKMGKAYLLPRGRWDGIPGMEGGGLDVLSPAFTFEAFRERLAGRRDQIRAFVMDKRALDSFGNAYADEVLFAAGIHPKTWCRSLDDESARRLHAAMVSVMSAATAEVARRGEPIEVKVRDFLKIRLREVCPQCGAKVRRAGVRGMDSYFCPRCQPETRPGLVDWRRTGV